MYDRESVLKRLAAAGLSPNLPAAHLNVLAGSWCVNEHTGTLNDKVNLHLSPWQLGGVTAADHADGLAVHADVAVINNLDVGIKLAKG